MSNIYNLDMGGMRKELQKFGKTLYGRTVFLIAYFIPFVAFFVMLFLFIALVISLNSMLYNAFFVVFGVFIVSFFIGTAYYYSELRKFINGH